MTAKIALTNAAAPMTANTFLLSFFFAALQISAAQVMQTAAATSAMPSVSHSQDNSLFEAGLDIKEVQYLAGHSTVDMTLRVYSHYDRQSREKQTIEKVREAFRKESA